MEFERDIVRARYRGHVVLASSSERRRQLMREAGYDFETRPSDVDESRVASPDPLMLAQLLAFEKASVVARRLCRDVVVGADTVVALEGDVLGKPEDREDARRILERLSGSTHEVVTGLCVIRAGGSAIVGAEVTRITMRALSAAELDDYVAGGEGLGKAGAYAIQETGDRFIARMEGSFTNVVGLPMGLLADFLDRVSLL